jgi:hypothetical protein
MPKKSRERYKNKAKENTEAKPLMTVEDLKRRRYRRLMFVGLIGLSFPVFEFIAYQFRAITITITNRADLMINKVQVTYDGGTFETLALKPGGSFTRVIRPNFTFTNKQFSTYAFTIRLNAENGMISQMGRAGAIDYSAKEIYTIQALPPDGRLQLQHTTRLGYPMALVRDLLERLGVG